MPSNFPVNQQFSWKKPRNVKRYFKSVKLCFITVHWCVVPALASDSVKWNKPIISVYFIAMRSKGTESFLILQFLEDEKNHKIL